MNRRESWRVDHQIGTDEAFVRPFAHDATTAKQSACGCLQAECLDGLKTPAEN
jgi:hypothetical protein